MLHSPPHDPSSSLCVALLEGSFCSRSNSFWSPSSSAFAAGSPAWPPEIARIEAMFPRCEICEICDKTLMAAVSAKGNAAESVACDDIAAAPRPKIYEGSVGPCSVKA